MSASDKKESVFDKITKDVAQKTDADKKDDINKKYPISKEVEDHVNKVVVSAYTADRIMVTEAIVNKTVDFLLRIVRNTCVRIGMSEEDFLQKHKNFFMNQDRGKKTAAAMYSNRNTYNRLLTRTDGDANEITFVNAKRILQDIFGLRINDITFSFFSPALGKEFSVSSSDTFTDMIAASAEDKKLSNGIDADSLSRNN